MSPTIDITAPASGAAFSVNQVVSLAATIIDPAADGFESTHTCSIDWGDGSTPTTGVVAGSGATRACAGTHAYSAAGSYTITATDTDNEGGRGMDTTTVVIDNTRPVITYTLDPATPTGNNGWYTGNVTIDWTVTDNESTAVPDVNTCVDQTINADTPSTGLVLNCSATSVGGSASESVTIKRDATASTIVATATNADGTAYTLGSWTNQNVTIHYTCSDTASGLDLRYGDGVTGCPSDDRATSQGLTTFNGRTVVDLAGNMTTLDPAPSVRIDRDAPTVVVSATTADGVAYTSGTWTNQTVTVGFTCDDPLSDIPVGTCPAAVVVNAETPVDGQAVSGSVTDNAGNTATSNVVTVKVDQTAPTGITFNGGIVNGREYVAGSVPAAPTCSATDALSGLQSCIVSGYSTELGTHTLTATATDNAGNAARTSASEQIVYTVVRPPWTIKGFYAPVDGTLSSPTAPVAILNSIKSGATVSLKFEIFDGETEVTDTAAVKSLTYKWLNPPVGTPTDDVELVATGGTSLRYDTTSGQFVYNWQTPKNSAGKSVRVTVAFQDGSTISADFLLK